jgi:threonylcarbamoyladenosine tRNA methylthiotransferase MtaB
MDPSRADIQVVNTCTVTRRAETKAVRYIRRAKRENGDQAIVVVGCAVERDPLTFRELPGVNLSLGTREKYDLPRFLGNGEVQTVPRVFRGGIAREGSPTDLEGIQGFEGRKRAFIKIQDGCDYLCSYCVIPAVRGRSVSRLPGAIIDEARLLIASGFREIVISGIHIGLFGRDLSPRISLEGLVEKLLGDTEGARFRLSSLDPHEISGDLIELMASTDRICNHLHVPLQSGSPAVLEAMKRRNSADLFLEVCSTAVSKIPTIGLGTDVIVGYPGESEADFELTCRVLERTPFSYIHIFPFSPRPGTTAYRLEGERIRDGIVKERVKAMAGLAKACREEFRRNQVGRLEEIVVERQVGTWQVGRCSNYLKAYFPSPRLPLGEMAEVKIEGEFRDGVRVSILKSLSRMESQ